MRKYFVACNVEDWGGKYCEGGEGLVVGDQCGEFCEKEQSSLLLSRSYLNDPKPSP